MRFTCVAIGVASLPSAWGKGHGYVSSEAHIPRVNVGDAPPAEHLVEEESLPTGFDWRNVRGKNFVTPDWNQHIPHYCGACWIHGTVSALQDRIKVMRNRAYPDIVLGRQSLMNCVPPASGKGAPPGCNGGDAWMIHNYMHKNPRATPDETCMPYRAQNMGCSPYEVCRNCHGNGTCWAVENYIGYGVSSYGKVQGEKAIMKEIFARGPVVCSFATDANFMFNFSEIAVQNEGVFLTDKKYNASQIDHDMEVTGWGVTPGGIKYWVVRNSWGTYWGDGGWLKLRRGTNELMSESDCAWAVPTWDDLDQSLEGKVLGDYAMGSLSATETAQKIHGGWLFGQEAMASTAPDVMSVGLACFVGGASTILVAVKVLAGKTRVEEQPFLLG